MQVLGWPGRRDEGGKAHGWWTTAARSVDVVGLAAECRNCGCGRVATAAIRHSVALQRCDDDRRKDRNTGTAIPFYTLHYTHPPHTTYPPHRIVAVFTLPHS